MSQYITSFIVEPVIRQARRFSRSSIGADSLPVQRWPFSIQDDNLPELPQAMVFDEEESGNALGLNGPQHRMLATSPLAESPVREVPHPITSEEYFTRPGRSLTSPAPSLNSTLASRRRIYTEARDDGRPMHSARPRHHSLHGSFHRPGDVSMSAERPGQSRRSTTEEDMEVASGSYSSAMGEGRLPANDGMGAIRKRITNIQKMELSNVEKSRLMHELMTEKYYSFQPAFYTSFQGRRDSHGSQRSQDTPLTPASGITTNDTTQGTSPHTSHSSFADKHDAFLLSDNDRKPTYYCKPAARSGDDSPDLTHTEHNFLENDIESEHDDRPLGCLHYKRNVKLQCSQCSRWYTCRFCHDKVEDHSLNRRETRNMLCMLCGSAQPAAEGCAVCGERAAWYYCDICKLWDNDPQKSIYHCDDCGICRVGEGLGKDFYHCKVTVAASLVAVHRLTLGRRVVYAYRYQNVTPIAASNDPRIATVLYVGNTCSPRLRQ